MNMIKDNFYEEIKQQGLSIDKDVFDYGITILMQYFLCLVFSFMISYYLKCVFEMMITILTWAGVRRYIGGFHFKNNTVCLICTTLIIVCISKVSQLLVLDLTSDMIFSIVSLMIINNVGCVDSKNKPLSIEEKMFYKKRGIKRVLVFMIFELGFRLIRFNKISNTILLVLQFNSINLLGSKLAKKEKRVI